MAEQLKGHWIRINNERLDTRRIITYRVEEELNETTKLMMSVLKVVYAYNDTTQTTIEFPRNPIYHATRLDKYLSTYTDGFAHSKSAEKKSE